MSTGDKATMGVASVFVNGRFRNDGLRCCKPVAAACHIGRQAVLPVVTRWRLLFVPLWLLGLPARAQAPEVYTTPHYQSPVRGGPGDLIVIPGHRLERGAQVVYMQFSGPTPPPPPTSVPSANTAAQGTLWTPDAGGEDAFGNAPLSITGQLPSVMDSSATYALYVQNPDSEPDEWSKPVVINDARPLWASPDLMHVNVNGFGGDRVLRITGRNLERMVTGGIAVPPKVRLSGPSPAPIELVALPADPDLEHYVVEVEVPAGLAVGIYDIELSMDWVHWRELPSNTLEIRADPIPKVIFAVHEYGDDEHPCQPDDGVDDTWCIREALIDAAVLGQGEVFFEDGQWDLIDPLEALQSPFLGWSTHHGLLVPPNVDLVGTHRDHARIVKHPQWDTLVVFTLLGGNRVHDLHFDEQIVGEPSGSDPFHEEPLAGAPTSTYFLQIGHIPWTPVPYEIEEVREVAIYDCRMTDMAHGMSDGGWPISRLYIHNNEFQVYHTAINLGGANNDAVNFTIEDAVVADNIFYPGDYISADRTQGTIATQLGAGRRVDFSRNFTDGRINGGWRASHFWHMSGSQEMLLVSDNLAYCTSDKAGDGEFIAFDGNRDHPGFEGMVAVLDADESKVMVDGQWRVPDTRSYLDHWLVVVDGTGVGQARKIVDYTEDEQPRIVVDPPFDVAPDPTSRVVAIRGYWSAYIVANEVHDDLASGCSKSNPIGVTGKGGVIGSTGGTWDSTIEANVQVEADGIVLHSGYSGVDVFDPPTWLPQCDPNDPQFDPSLNCAPVYMGYRTTVKYAVEVVANDVDGEYAWNVWPNPSSVGGVRLMYDAEPTFQNPVLGYNVVVADNSIRQSDSGYLGAITLRRSWHMPETWRPAYLAATIFDNLVADADWGIALPHPEALATALADNVQDVLQTPAGVQDLAAETWTLP